MYGRLILSNNNATAKKPEINFREYLLLNNLFLQYYTYSQTAVLAQNNFLALKRRLLESGFYLSKY